MKKTMVWLLLLVFAFSGSAYALEIDGILGGLTSMFAPDPNEAYRPQELVELEDINIKLTNVMESKSSDLYSLAEGNEYLIVEFMIENKNDEDLALSTMLSFSTWCDGELCTISLEALGTAMFAGKMQLDCVVAPGESATGVIGYEVPIDWKEMVIQYKGDDIIGKTIDFVVEK